MDGPSLSAATTLALVAARDAITELVNTDPPPSPAATSGAAKSIRGRLEDCAGSVRELKVAIAAGASVPGSRVEAHEKAIDDARAALRRALASIAKRRKAQEMETRRALLGSATAAEERRAALLAGGVGAASRSVAAAMRRTHAALETELKRADATALALDEGSALIGKVGCGFKKVPEKVRGH